MWGDDTANEGGFDVSGYNTSPSVPSQDNKQSRKPNSLFPLAIKQILSNTEDSMTISGYPVSMMTVIGIVRSIEVTSTKIAYIVEDWTDSIVGMLWIEGDSSDHKSSGVIENTYCRMTGTKRMHDDKPCMFVYNISPIEDMTEITHHFLQVMFIGLKADEMRNVMETTQPIPYQSTTSSSINSNSSSTRETNVDTTGIPSLTPNQRLVYQAVKQCKHEQGMNVADITESLKGRITIPEIEKALQFLTDEGHMYNTIDDDYFKITGDS